MALITGDGTGIGRSAAESLLAFRAKVVINGRREDILTQAQSQIDAPGKKVTAVVGDIANPVTSHRPIPAEGMEALRGFFEKAEKWVAKTTTEGVEAGEFQSRLRPRHMADYILAALEGGLVDRHTRKHDGYERAVLDQSLAQLKK